MNDNSEDEKCVCHLCECDPNDPENWIIIAFGLKNDRHGCCMCGVKSTFYQLEGDPELILKLTKIKHLSVGDPIYVCSRCRGVVTEGFKICCPAHGTWWCFYHKFIGTISHVKKAIKPSLK